MPDQSALPDQPPGPGQPAGRSASPDQPPGPGQPAGSDQALIAAQLAELGDHLPADLVDELADGLRETYRHHLSRQHDPELAARTAITEFGDAEILIGAYRAQAPGRRTAALLLVTGPIVGAGWATALVAERAWTWSVPAPVKIAFGITLIGTIAALGALARQRLRYRMLNRGAAVAAIIVIALDAVLIAAALRLGPPGAGLLRLAAVLSAARLAATATRLPTLLRA